MEFVQNDGGRADAGYIGDAGDCVTRAIAIAAELPYIEVYKTLHAMMKAQPTKATGKRNRSPRNGVPRTVYDPYLSSIEWEWVPTMHIGEGCRVHLRADELPAGRLIVRVTKHLCAVIDGVVHDTHDPSRDGTRCVYGYWRVAQ